MEGKLLMKLNHGLKAIGMPSREEPKDRGEEQNGRLETTIWRPIPAQLRLATNLDSAIPRQLSEADAC
jgi:hypothetical protein